MNQRPKVTIGLPVYNGERFLSQAIESVLNQSFGDFGLVICDNASLDRTQAICTEFSLKDARVKYHRNQTNIGGPANFNLTYELSTGEYFKWMAHDDVIAPTFLEKCIRALEEDGSAVLAHPKTGLIDEQGRVLGEYVERLQTGSADAHKRFHSLIAIKHSCFQIFGVVRSDILKNTKLLVAYASSDRWFLAHLALLGRFVEVPEYLYYRRSHKGASWDQEDRYSWSWWNPYLKSRITFPFARKIMEYSKAIGSSSLGSYEKMMCYAQIARLIGDALGRAIIPRWQAAFQESQTFLPISDHDYDRH